MVRKISLFVVDDEKRFLDLMKKTLTGHRYNIELFDSGKKVLDSIQNKEFDVGLIDIGMPDINGLELLKRLKERNILTELIMLTGQADVPTAIESMKLGCYDYLTKPVSIDELEIIIQKAYEKKRLNKENIVLKEELLLKEKYQEMIGKCEKMKQVFSLIDKVAKTPSLVLITGESGTGKELVARAIHKASARKDNPFIIVDCASLPENLLENELFGHEKGAFTDAVTMKRGLVEVADEGTLFIDEIGEMPITLQAKLLRVIETQRFRRLGSNREIAVDVRIIAATNRTLKSEVEKGNFREDLFYRLNVFPIKLPPLRERKEDIPILIKHFMDTTKVTSIKKTINPACTEILTEYSWPGNVRELANVIERMIIVSSASTITTNDLPMEFIRKPKDVPAKAVEPSIPLPAGQDDEKSLKDLVQDFEKSVLEKYLSEFDGDKLKVAKTLGLSRAQLYRKLK